MSSKSIIYLVIFTTPEFLIAIGTARRWLKSITGIKARRSLGPEYIRDDRAH